MPPNEPKLLSVMQADSDHPAFGGEEVRMSWVDHLEELRRRILIVVSAGLIVWVAAFYYSELLLRLAMVPLKGQTLYFFSPVEGFFARLKLAFMVAAAVTLPVALDQTRRFIAPAVSPENRRMLWALPLAGWMLFLTGAAFGLFFVLPTGLKFLMSYGSAQLKPMISVGEYLSFIAWMLLGFGVAFEWPMVIWVLSKMGVVNRAFLRQMRPYAAVGIFILAAVLTPGPDIFSQVLLAVPCLGLYEMGIWLSVPAP